MVLEGYSSEAMPMEALAESAEVLRHITAKDKMDAMIVDRVVERYRCTPACAPTLCPSTCEQLQLVLQVHAQRIMLARLEVGLPVSDELLRQATGEATDVPPDDKDRSLLEGPRGILSVREFHLQRREAVMEQYCQDLNQTLPRLLPPTQLQALLEIKKLRLRHLQRELRQQVVLQKWLREDCGSSMLLDWSHLRLVRPIERPQGLLSEGPLFQPRPSQPPPPEAPQISAEEAKKLASQEHLRKAALQRQKAHEEEISRQRALDEEERKKQQAMEDQRRLELELRVRAILERQRFLLEVLGACRELKAQGAATAKRREMRAKGARAWHNREKTRHLKELSVRVMALKNHNYEEYIRLAKSAKNEQLRKLLYMTDKIMEELTGKVVSHRRLVAIEEEQEGMVSDDGDDKAEEEGEDDDAEAMIRRQQQYYEAVHQNREDIPKAPSLLEGGSLRSYQLDGLRFMASLHANKMNGILADEMGLGKTVQTVALLAYLLEKKNNKGPHLVLAPKAVLSNWVKEFEKWCPSLVTVLYDGTPDERKVVRTDYVEKGSFNVCLTHYDMVMRDRAMFTRVAWEHLVVDEGHRLKNAESKLVGILKDLKFKTRLLLTGTPIQNSLNELWALLNFLLPKVFESSETFDEWFAAPFKGQTEDVQCQLGEEEQLLIINRLHQVIRPFMLRRTKAEVEKELPAKTEHVIKCDMSAWQKLVYEKITTRGSVAMESGKEKSLSNLTMHLRKTCNHPYLLLQEMYLAPDPEELVRASGKMVLLDNVLKKLKRTGHRVLLFSQMVRMLDIIHDYLDMRGYQFLRIDGSTNGETRSKAIDQFNQEGSPYFLMILSTRAGGLGLNLQTADTVIMFDSDWNPQMDLQAEDRAHRIGQKREVLVLILVSAGTVEEEILDKASRKRDLDAKVIQAGMYNNKASNAERQEALQMIIRKGVSQFGDTVHTNDEVNVMLSRSEDELRIFMEMDGASDADGASRPPLLTLEEVPPWLIKEEEVEDEEETEELDDGGDGGGRRRRRRRTTGTYHEMNDREFDELLAGEPEPVVGLSQSSGLGTRRKRAREAEGTPGPSKAFKAASAFRRRSGVSSGDLGTMSGSPGGLGETEATSREGRTHVLRVQKGRRRQRLSQTAVRGSSAPAGLVHSEGMADEEDVGVEVGSAHKYLTRRRSRGRSLDRRNGGDDLMAQDDEDNDEGEAAEVVVMDEVEDEEEDGEDGDSLGLPGGSNGLDVEGDEGKQPTSYYDNFDDDDQLVVEVGGEERDGREEGRDGAGTGAS